MGAIENPVKVVFDCNVLLQAAANPIGPAAACMDLVRQGQLLLIMHSQILAEFRSVALRPKVAKKLRLDEAIVEAFVEDVLSHSQLAENVQDVFTHPIDAKDNIYINVAVAARAVVITTRDFHLLNLVDSNRVESIEFRQRFPDLQILTPVALLQLNRLG